MKSIIIALIFLVALTQVKADYADDWWTTGEY